MGMIRTRHPDDDAQDCASAERLLVGAIRWSLYRMTPCALAPRTVPALAGDLQIAGGLFRQAHETMIRWQGAGLLVAPAGALALTRHERRLLHAAAAAQADDAGLADNYLFQLSPNAQVRPMLVCAVTFLATSLAIAGHWLPAPALPIARLGGAIRTR